MSIKRKLAVALPLVVLASTPALAAEDMPPLRIMSAGSSLQAEHRSGAFAGAQLRMTFNKSKAVVPVARLTLGRTSQYADPLSPGWRAGFLNSTFELGLTKLGKAELFLSGQRVTDVQKRLGFRGSSATTLMVVGGLALVGAGVLILSNDDDVPSPCPPGVEICAY